MSCAELLLVGSRGQEILRLGVGGCIRGPLTVRRADGAVLLDIPAGSFIPANCESALK